MDRYFPSIAKSDDFRLVGVHDISQDALDAASKEHGVAAFADLDAFLANRDMEAVVVTTYHPHHAAISIKGLKAGKHVITEKPMATSLKDAQDLKKTVDATGRIFMALPYDNYPAIEKARELVKTARSGACAPLMESLPIRGLCTRHGFSPRPRRVGVSLPTLASILSAC